MEQEHTMDSANLLFQLPQPVPPPQQQGNNLLDVGTKRLLTDPLLMRHFSILDFEDTEEFGFQSKWAALCKQMDRNGAPIMKMRKTSLHTDLLH